MGSQVRLLNLTDAEAEKVRKEGQYLLIKTAVSSAFYPLNCVKILFQLGYEPFSLSSGKFLWVLREAYYLPNCITYAKRIGETHGYAALVSGLDASVMAQLTAGLTGLVTTIYMNRHEPDLGGKPVNLDKEESELSDMDSARRVLRSAIRDSISHTVSLIVSRPFAVIMVRQVAQIVGGETLYHNVLQSLRLVGTTEGPRGLFSGLIPQLIAEYISVWGVHAAMYGVERLMLRAQQNAIAEGDKEGEDFTNSTRKTLHFVIPILVNTFAYPFQLCSTVMAVAGSGLVVSVLPYSPPFALWHDCYDYLKPSFGLQRGSRMFWREHRGPVSVGKNEELFAANKHFV